MARPTRPNIAGGVYHVMARGNERRAIYFDDEDRERFLELLSTTARRCRWECLAYCLMDNHYHLVLRTPLPNLSRGMRLINGGYASRVNARHGRVGHLFQGRFKSVLIRSSDHLLVVMKYVVRNPVVAQLCSTPGDWRWSSYQATVAGQSHGPLACEAALAVFGADEHAARRFALFMLSEDTTELETALTADVDFPSECYDGGVGRPSLEEILALAPNAAGIARAYHEYGYSLESIAAVRGTSRAVVGRMLVAYESAETAAVPAPTERPDRERVDP